MMFWLKNFKTRGMQLAKTRCWLKNSNCKGKQTHLRNLSISSNYNNNSLNGFQVYKNEYLVYMFNINVNIICAYTFLLKPFLFISKQQNVYLPLSFNK